MRTGRLHANSLMWHDTVMKTVDELLGRAMPTSGVGVKVDPGTGAVTLMLMFDGHLPFAAAIGRDQFLEMLDDIAKQSRRKAH